MSKIKQMPAALSNQIAAGEVVERPASVVKELVENSIDAGASIISVYLEEAGISQIMVQDNGEGMDAEDLQLAFLPHATSKIYRLNDLFNVHSLGFRGEALASIGSVAKVRVESCQAGQDQANFVEIAGSKLMNQGQCAGNQGTKIEVKSLFYNTPARLKHLKTLQTELKHIIRFVQNMALAYPQIQFSLFNNQQKLFQTSGRGRLQESIAQIYQANLARQLIALNVADDDFKVSGFISPPTLTRTSRNYIHWFVNGRAVYSNQLNQVLIKAYGRQLMIGRYPISILAIDLDPRLVDANVHPTKQTVRLSKESELAKLIQDGVKACLGEVNPVPNLGQTLVAQDNYRLSERTIPLDLNGSIGKVDSNFQHQQDPDQVDQEVENKLVRQENCSKPPMSHYQALEQALGIDRENSCSQGNDQRHPTRALPDSNFKAVLDSEIQQSSEVYERETEKQGIDFAALRYVGQIHGTYLIAESESGFYLIDQHAAQERLRYEHFMTYDPDVTLQQDLLLPHVFEFSLEQMTTIEIIKPSLEKLGIFLENLGPNSYQLPSYPNWILDEDLDDLIYGLVDRLLKEPDLTVAQLKEASIIMSSCRGAIKANHYLAPKEAEALIKDMAHLEDPYHCPHGRPVFVEFDQKSLEKIFKRIQDSHEGGQVR